MTSAQPNPDEGPKRHWLRYVFSIIIVVLVVWGGMRACSDAGLISSDTPFVIAQQRISNSIYIAGKERNAEAFFKDVIYRVAEEQGFKVRIITVSPSLALLGMDRGDYDGIITTMVPDPTNLRFYKFSDPIYRIGAVLIVPSGSSISSLEQMDGKIIGIPREESTFFDVGVYPNLIFYSYNDEIDALEDLENGQVEGVIMNAWPAYVLTSTLFNGRLKVATEPFTDDGVRIATLKDSRLSLTLPVFNRGLEKLKEDGMFEDLLAKWGLISTSFWEEDYLQKGPHESTDQ